MRWWIGLAVAAGCSEYQVGSAPDEGKDGVTDTGTTTTTTTTTSSPPAEEICDGLDNDGDGKVDEKFPDTDDDGVADCVDDACETDALASSAVEPLEECLSYNPGSVTDPWNVTLEWSFTAAGSIVVSPVTGQLTDDNGDGVIDSLDVPDVAFTSYTYGRLYIVSGDGSGEICHQDGWRYDGGVIIADVDSDGVNEVVGPFGDNTIRAVDGACNVEWSSASSYPGLLYPVTTAADLDQDGDVEVISDVAVVDGATGADRGTLSMTTSCWRAPTTGDLDQDGDTEIILGDAVFDSNGIRLWGAVGSGTSCFNAIVNLDADVNAEVVFSYGTDIIAYEDDGTEIWRKNLTVANPGPPCAGDIDGDGLVEIVAPSGTSLMAVESDGTGKWNVPMQDFSGAAGCSVFDMNGDGTYEVLFADEAALRVYDGATGAVLYQNDTHDSVTYFETPTVADVDNDGSAEMLVVNAPFGYGGTTGLTVFGHNGSGWPESGPTWGLHDFSATNQDPDGTIPTGPVASWLAYNVFRGRPYDDVPGTPNLVAAVVDVCVSSCDEAVGVVTIAYQVTNDGGADSADTDVALYLVQGGVPTLYATQAVPTAAFGEVQASLTFDVPLADWTGEFQLVVDDGAAVGECHEDDNVAAWTGDVCP